MKMKDTYRYIMKDPFMNTFMMPAIEKEVRVNNNSNLFTTPQDGFLRGNMQKNTYVPYKDMTYLKPVIKDERQNMLYKLQEIAFAAHEINLYLDTHPEDKNCIMLYNKYLNEERRLNDEYERKYGPIDLSDPNGLNVTPWAWIKEPWPWNK